MARSLNKVMLIGNLGVDPEIRHTSSGVPVANFRMATSRSWSADGGKTEERTEWHNIVAWRKLAEICQQYLKKGSKVYIEGRIETRSWDDASTGQKRYMTEIIADQMIMLDSAPGGGGRRAGSAQKTSQDAGANGGEYEFPESDYDDDLPF
ncbi:MAG: single-stranded DNA-binding protein [Gemmatimonadota bacterium]